MSASLEKEGEGGVGSAVVILTSVKHQDTVYVNLCVGVSLYLWVLIDNLGTHQYPGARA